jgi:hypothetical protein
MSFIILAVIFIMVVFALGKFKNYLSIAGAFLIIYGLNALFLYYGLSALDGGDTFILLGEEISRALFYHLNGVWFAGNIITSMLILRNYKRYLKVNRKI